jgi:hypothetical protein
MATATSKDATDRRDGMVKMYEFGGMMKMVVDA